MGFDVIFGVKLCRIRFLSETKSCNQLFFSRKNRRFFILFLLIIWFFAAIKIQKFFLNLAKKLNSSIYFISATLKFVWWCNKCSRIGAHKVSWGKINKGIMSRIQSILLKQCHNQTKVTSNANIYILWFTFNRFFT